MSSTCRIEDEILSYLRRGELANDRLLPDTDLIEAGLLDSMLVMDLVHFIHAQYAIQLEPEDIAPRNFRTITAMATCVRARLRDQSRAA